ncbi:hypothetical protein C8R45DRAFT_1132559 [Mycena sanguinolenta]|nr:hypothetical protein C8R45DRAFT_1132559 [Mycena sanguinolenta]
MYSHSVRQNNPGHDPSGQNHSASPSGDGPHSTSTQAASTSSFSTKTSISQPAESSSTLASASSSSTTPGTTSLSPPSASSYADPLPTYPVAQASGTHKQKISSGAVVGIVLVIIAFLACAGIAVLWRIRRRRLQSRHQFTDDVEMRRGGRTISPFTLLVEDPRSDTSTANATGLAMDSDARSISASTIARQQLETQLRAATEKMVELEELVDTGDPNAGLGAGGGQGERQEQGRSAGGGGELEGQGQGPPSDWELQMRAAKAQIDMLLARMNAIDSAWGMGVGMGMGGEPPPQYT